MNTQVAPIDRTSAEAFHDRIAHDACPLCNATDFEPLEDADCSRHPAWKPPLSPRMTWMACRSCDHIFTEGYLSPAALDLISEQIQAHQRPAENVEAGRNASATIVGKVQTLKRSGRWLDVNFGNGSLMFTAQECGFEVLGIDRRREIVDEMGTLGFRAECQDLGDVADLEPVDVISMVGSLERTTFPAHAVDAAARLLAPGGILVISTPNTDAFLWQVMTKQKTNPYWADVTQQHIFGRARLFKMLEASGFDTPLYTVSSTLRCGMDVLARKA
jgi:2-polyprenyl-3-methyl-5-hydroxy-6-metoxy-1,4-benzoquinol methylase